MRCLGHTVYVVAIEFPAIVDHDLQPDGIVRPAEPADLGVERLGVLKAGRIVSLSTHEVAELQRREVDPRS